MQISFRFFKACFVLLFDWKAWREDLMKEYSFGSRLHVSRSKRSFQIFFISARIFGFLTGFFTFFLLFVFHMGVVLCMGVRRFTFLHASEQS